MSYNYGFLGVESVDLVHSVDVELVVSDSEVTESDTNGKSLSRSSRMSH